MSLILCAQLPSLHQVTTCANAAPFQLTMFSMFVDTAGAFPFLQIRNVVVHGPLLTRHHATADSWTTVENVDAPGRIDQGSSAVYNAI